MKSNSFCDSRSQKALWKGSCLCIKATRCMIPRLSRYAGTRSDWQFTLVVVCAWYQVLEQRRYLNMLVFDYDSIYETRGCAELYLSHLRRLMIWRGMGNLLVSRFMEKALVGRNIHTHLTDLRAHQISKKHDCAFILEKRVTFTYSRKLCTFSIISSIAMKNAFSAEVLKIIYLLSLSTLFTLCSG